MTSPSPMVWVQAFGMNAEGGSARIFRSLLGNLQANVLVHGQAPPPASRFSEVFIRDRLNFGRLENSRFWGILQSTRALHWPTSRRQIRHQLDCWNPPLVHSHVHGTGFVHAMAWCRERRVPHAASFHDDIRHLTLGDPLARIWDRQAGMAWRSSHVRFVISPEMGAAYESRYGAAPWITVTDGLDSIAESPRAIVSKRLHLYFAGALNVPYEPCFLALQQAMKRFQNAFPDWSVRMILRGGRSIRGSDPAAPPFEVRPFADQADVLRDFEDVDGLYLPLSLDARYANFARFSLSTKLVTYLGSGLPIFYHGPSDSAAWRLLNESAAAHSCHSLDPDAIFRNLQEWTIDRQQSVPNALNLARRDFQLEKIRLRFLGALPHLGSAA